MRSPSHGGGRTRRRLVFICGVVPVFLTAVLALYRPAALGRLDDTVYDMLLRSSRPQPPGDRVVIVDVDERSLSTIGQWPWRRNVIARLIARLRAMGASTIALDIIFAESDRYERVEGMNRRVRESPQRYPDDVLADTLKDGRVVLGYALTFDAAAPAPSACVLHSLGLAIVRPREETDDAPFFHATGVVCSLPALGQAAGVSGLLNAAPDSD